MLLGATHSHARFARLLLGEQADPTGDLSGMDAAVKVVALAVALGLGAGRSGTTFSLADVDVSGIQVWW